MGLWNAETLIKKMVIGEYGITLIARSDNHKNSIIEYSEYLIVIGVVT